jgi:hypothetical protein
MKKDIHVHSTWRKINLFKMTNRHMFVFFKVMISKIYFLIDYNAHMYNNIRITTFNFNSASCF